MDGGIYVFTDIYIYINGRASMADFKYLYIYIYFNAMSLAGRCHGYLYIHKHI